MDYRVPGEAAGLESPSSKLDVGQRVQQAIQGLLRQRDFQGVNDPEFMEALEVRLGQELQGKVRVRERESGSVTDAVISVPTPMGIATVEGTNSRQTG